MEQVKRLILKACSSGNAEYFIYPLDKFPNMDFVKLLKEMENEDLIIIKGRPAIGACHIQITSYGLSFLK